MFFLFSVFFGIGFLYESLTVVGLTAVSFLITIGFGILDKFVFKFSIYFIGLISKFDVEIGFCLLLIVFTT